VGSGLWNSVSRSLLIAAPDVVMKITFVLDGGDNLSGGHGAIAMFARGLVQLGHDVTLVARPKRRRSLRERARPFLEGIGRQSPKRRPVTSGMLASN
jgi:hypothetical protein